MFHPTPRPATSAVLTDSARPAVNTHTCKWCGSPLTVRGVGDVKVEHCEHCDNRCANMLRGCRLCKNVERTSG